MTEREGEPCTKVAARLALDLLRCKMGLQQLEPKGQQTAALSLLCAFVPLCAIIVIIGTHGHLDSGSHEGTKAQRRRSG
jgi:hypothetical protein